MKSDKELRDMGLSEEHISALRTPLRQMTPTLMAMAIEAKDMISAHNEVENSTYVRPKGVFMIITDCQPFESPVEPGRVVGGKTDLREHLKRTGCRVVDPCEAKNHRVSPTNQKVH